MHCLQAGLDTFLIGIIAGVVDFVASGFETIGGIVYVFISNVEFLNGADNLAAWLINSSC